MVGPRLGPLRAGASTGEEEGEDGDDEDDLATTLTPDVTVSTDSPLAREKVRNWNPVTVTTEIM